MSQKVTVNDEYYSAIKAAIHAQNLGRMSGTKARDRHRALIKIRKAKGEARRTEDPQILEDACIAELMKIVGA